MANTAMRLKYLDRALCCLRQYDATRGAFYTCAPTGKARESITQSLLLFWGRKRIRLLIGGVYMCCRQGGNIAIYYFYSPQSSISASTTCEQNRRFMCIQPPSCTKTGKYQLSAERKHQYINVESILSKGFGNHSRRGLVH